MKYLNNWKKRMAVLLLLSINITSCSKFLEEDPKHLVNVANYYQTETDAIAAVNSIYAYLNSINDFAIGGNTAGIYHSTFWVAMGLASDEMENNQLGTPQFDQLSSFVFNSQNSAFFDIWEKHYKAITIANIAISRVPAINMNATLRARLVGEAKFLRGLLYFNMVRIFPKMPLLTAENNPLYPAAATREEIYTQVIKDLQDAAPALPLQYAINSGRGRATSGAANALLAKVFLTQEKWRDAATYAKKVIDAQQYELWTDYADVFKLSSRGGKEAIFSVGFGDKDGAISFWEVGQFNVRLLPAELSLEKVQNAQGWQRPTQYLYNQYELNDRRRTVNFITKVYDSTQKVEVNIRPYFSKYWDRVAEPKGNASSNDFPVIRYADVLLMYAEAANELNQPGDAHIYINMVRKRARYNGTVYAVAVPDYADLTKEQFRTAVLKERMLELPCEGHRWFDLVRTKKLEALVPLAKAGITPSTANYMFPIPQYEQDLNPNLK